MLNLPKELNLNNAFCKAILCILSYSQPRDFFTHNIININEIFIKSKKNELHHIFPVKSEVGKKYRGMLINSISNISFLPKDTNIYISNKNPKDYFTEAQTKNKHFNEDVKTHLIPMEDVFSNNFESFLKNRGSAILNEVNTLIGISSDIHKRLKDMPDEVWNEFELEIRKIIDLKLSNKYEQDYWRSDVIPEDLRNNVNEKIKKELRLRPDLKEQFGTSRAKLDNCDVMDYLKIILKNWEIFEDVFGSKEETQTQFKNLQIFRNALKHIKTYSDSTELDELTQKKGEVSLLWLKKILKVEDTEKNINIDFTTIDELYSQLKERILSFGQDVKIEQKKHYTAFKKKSNFVCSKLQNSQIKLWVRIPKEKFNDSRKIARDVSKVGHLGTGNYEIIFSSKEDLNYVVGLLKQAYNEDIKSTDEFDSEYHIKKLKDEKLRGELNILRKRILEIDDKIIEHFSKSHIKYKSEVDFCLIYVQKNNFWVDVKLNRNEIKSKTLDVREHKDQVWTHIRFSEQTDINELHEIIKLAYNSNR